jgi:NAD(P)-dependent dehydrogenase (short-subunit alcohol dehydrogenase family)
MRALEGQTAIVTGVGGGFGRAIALALADAGAAVTLTARRSHQIDDVKRIVEEAGGRAQAIIADLMDTAAAARVYSAHKQAFGSLHILVNSGGAADPYGPIGEVDPVAWWRTMGAHVLGPVNYITAVIDDMKKAGFGIIINICSLDALRVRANQSAYCVAKSAQMRLSEHIAQECTGSGVAVFAVHPGYAMTPPAESMLHSEEARRWLPDFVKLVESVKAMGGNMEDLTLCGEKCVALATGRFNHLTGTFINFHEFNPENSTPPA